MSVGLKYMAAVIGNEAGSSLLKLDPQYLIDEREQQVYEFMKGYYRSYREVPTAGMVTEHTGVRLPRAEGALNFHLSNLHDRFDFEILRSSYVNFRELMQAGNPGPVVQAMEGTIRRIRRTRRGNSMLDAHQSMDLVIERLRGAMAKGGLSGVPSPWPSLNEKTGGYQDSDLITYVGRTGLGKTAMLLAQMEASFDAGYSCLFVTTEMGSEQIARRWMAMRYGLNPQNLKKGTVSSSLLRRMAQYRTELLGRERFRLLAVGTGAKVNLIEAAIEEIDPDIVYIDGAYLLYPSLGGGYMKQTERVTAVFDELKQLTIDSRKPHVVTTQFNRVAGRGGKEGTLETIGLSDAIGWHSSLVVAVKPGPTDNPLESRELDILKGREGEEGKLAINFKFRPVDFSEITREDLMAMQGGPMLNTETDWS